MVIALITIFNVVNSIAMSVASRTKQYGAFRAIGLSTRQLSKMVVAEAGAYALSGSVAGTVLGLLANRLAPCSWTGPSFAGTYLRSR